MFGLFFEHNQANNVLTLWLQINDILDVYTVSIYSTHLVTNMLLRMNLSLFERNLFGAIFNFSKSIHI